MASGLQGIPWLTENSPEEQSGHRFPPVTPSGTREGAPCPQGVSGGGPLPGVCWAPPHMGGGAAEESLLDSTGACPGQQCHNKLSTKI